jgi:4-hydroxy-2-oxoheptanedioate aldolase
MELQMRRSKVLEKLRNGQIVCCFKTNLTDGRVSEIAAITGFDCIWIDQEHIGQDWSSVTANIWAAKAHDTDILVRIARGGYNDYIKPLELDASGILVPHVMGLEDAKKIIKMTRFYPIGRRPIDGGNSDGSYTALDFNSYIKQANDQRFIALQIEDPEPLKELEDLAALNGFDMLFFGPGDFSQGIGAPGEWDHPEIRKVRKQIPQIARKYGKFSGTVGTPENLKELIDYGYQFVNLGSDVVGLKNYCHQLNDSFVTTISGKNIH